MGAYLSTPNLEKNSEDGNEHIHYGASSMQGWRISQEVFFVVYLLTEFTEFHSSARSI